MASLIKDLSADGQFKLQKGNAGIRDDDNQKDRDKEKFEEIWKRLIKQEAIFSSFLPINH